MSMDLSALPVSGVKGVGPRKAAELEALGIRNVLDLLEHYPFRYEDYRIRDLAEAKDGDKLTVQGIVSTVPVLQRYGRSKTRMSCKVAVEGRWMTAVFFNRHFLKDRLTPGVELVLTGKWDQRRAQLTVSECEFPDSRVRRSGTLQPVYSTAGELTQTFLRKAIATALTQFGAMIPEILPHELMDKHRLLPRRQAVALIHQPGEFAETTEARRRMVYEELFLFQLKLQAYRALNRDRADGVAHAVPREEVRGFVRGLPFTLTPSQKQVIAEVLDDLEQPYCMNRLLQGDVGSGKTVVAAVAMFAVVKTGAQAALMVPTEILAEQHARTLQQWFEPYGVRVGLLTGRLTDRQRRDVLGELQMGLLDIVVGTHALIQEDVYFRNLGVVVTDEQHRFGVNQRSLLRRKGHNPDILTMTATPIPRTLAISAFGDMDVSTLRELPKGRKPIETYWVKSDKLDRVVAFIRRETEKGRQAYVICPLIEESEKLDVQNAVELHAMLSQALPDIRIDLLHGRMSGAEKDQTMLAFARHESQVLVSTTVIEVGVNVPNATLMIVHDADRFGLSQLHQLRGRVGRGEHQSYCVLIADPKSDVGKERMKVMTETNDGFEISRRDLELRGPGDFFGTKQSGLPEFRIADLVADFEAMELAREDAARLAGSAEFWTGAAYLPLRRVLQKDEIFSGVLLD